MADYSFMLTDQVVLSYVLYLQALRSGGKWLESGWGRYYVTFNNKEPIAKSMTNNLPLSVLAQVVD